MACLGPACVRNFRATVTPQENNLQIQSTHDMGRGVFARGPIAAGTYLGEYLGKLDPYSKSSKPSLAIQLISDCLVLRGRDSPI